MLPSRLTVVASSVRISAGGDGRVSLKISSGMSSWGEVGLHGAISHHSYAPLRPRLRFCSRLRHSRADALVFLCFRMPPSIMITANIADAELVE